MQLIVSKVRKILFFILIGVKCRPVTFSENRVENALKLSKYYRCFGLFTF